MGCCTGNMQPGWCLALGLEAALRLSSLAMCKMNAQKRLFSKVLGRRGLMREKLMSRGIAYIESNSGTAEFLLWHSLGDQQNAVHFYCCISSTITTQTSCNAELWVCGQPRPNQRSGIRRSSPWPATGAKAAFRAAPD